MRKIIFGLLGLFVFVVFLPLPVLADILPESSRSVVKCVKFVNLDYFPNIVLIGRYAGPMTKYDYETYQVENNKCLSQYKLNSLDIYWSTKEKPDLIVDNRLLLKAVEASNYSVNENNPLAKETVEYLLAKSFPGRIVAYKNRKILEYDDGSEKIKNYIPLVQKNVQKLVNFCWRTVEFIYNLSSNISNYYHYGIWE